MEVQPLQLYWRETLIGYIYEAGWLDFPWVNGRFVPTENESEVRAMLQWFHEENKKDDPDLTLAPFPDHFIDNWTIVKPDGTRTEIMPPVPNFDEETIEWR